MHSSVVTLAFSAAAAGRIHSMPEQLCESLGTMMTYAVIHASTISCSADWNAYCYFQPCNQPRAWYRTLRRPSGCYNVSLVGELIIDQRSYTL